jgi:tagaturonate reductase
VAAAVRPREGDEAGRPQLSGAQWPADAYDRARLPERVLQFGTGMLLRALPVALVDAANRAGAFAGRIVIVQSTPNGLAAAINAQDGLFTLVERGAERGTPVERTRLIGAVSRALVATDEWAAVRDVAASPALRAIVSNVTEAGFRLDAGERLAVDAPVAPASFPAKLTDLLHTRFRRAPNAPPLIVVPTELVDDNGPRLRAMVEQLADSLDDAADFRTWLASHVRFCSSLVDRITTGTPSPELHRQLEARLGYADALLTVAEPYALWAVEGEPAELRDALAIDVAQVDASDQGAIFARDISTYRERKIRLLNGSHTALAPLARLSGCRTVRDAVEDARLGPFLRRILFDEIVPSVDLPPESARAFAESVLDRFSNPWLDHEWSVIATNQTAKTRLRVVPSVVAYAAKFGRVPEGLALALAACVRHARSRRAHDGAGSGWWRGATYRVVDADLSSVARHWKAAEGDPEPTAVPPDVARRVVESALADESLWGTRLTSVPGLTDAVSHWLATLERDGTDGALDALAGA